MVQQALHGCAHELRTEHGCNSRLAVKSKVAEAGVERQQQVLLAEPDTLGGVRGALGQCARLVFKLLPQLLHLNQLWKGRDFGGFPRL